MVPTRRQALGSTAALLAGFAGCNSPAGVPTPDDCIETDGADPGRNVAVNPPTVTVRRPGRRDPVLGFADADRDPDCAVPGQPRAVERGFVTTARAASLLRIDDVEGAPTARQFVEETDFEREFLFVDRGTVGQCYELVLCAVTWTATELERTYGKVYRDYDVACSTDEYDRVARLVRLEGNVDARRIETAGRSTYGGGCPDGREPSNDRTGGTATGTGTTATGATATGTTATNDAPDDNRTTDARAADASPRPVEWER